MAKCFASCGQSKRSLEDLKATLNDKLSQLETGGPSRPPGEADGVGRRPTALVNDAAADADVAQHEALREAARGVVLALVDLLLLLPSKHR